MQDPYTVDHDAPTDQPIEQRRAALLRDAAAALRDVLKVDCLPAGDPVADWMSTLATRMAMAAELRSPSAAEARSSHLQVL